MMKSGLRLGILGGGQLARMIAQAASRLGLELTIFAQPGEPATQVCSRVFPGSLKNIEDLRRFFSGADLVIFENEFIPCDLLEQAAIGTSVQFAPRLDSMRFLQDKLNQKAALAKLGIPSAPYIPRTGDLEFPDHRDWLLHVLANFPKGAVLKWAQMGYDGKGTFFLSSVDDIERAFIFCNEAELRNLPLYAEERIAFRRELALVSLLSSSGLSSSGEFASYPLTISEQEKGVCVRVRGPATAFRVPSRTETHARRYAEKLARELRLTGAFAIEFFETSKGALLVNEIAPRVHNSGHFSLDAAETDQFENHLRAVLGLPLGSTRSEAAFIMLNLLGPEAALGRRPCRVLPEPGPRTHLHWYGKAEVAPRRKMGHLNGSATSVAKLRAVTDELQGIVSTWNRAQENKVSKTRGASSK